MPLEVWQGFGAEKVIFPGCASSKIAMKSRSATFMYIGYHTCYYGSCRHPSTWSRQAISRPIDYIKDWYGFFFCKPSYRSVGLGGMCKIQRHQHYNFSGKSFSFRTQSRMWKCSKILDKCALYQSQPILIGGNVQVKICSVPPPPPPPTHTHTLPRKMPWNELSYKYHHIFYCMYQ